MKNYSSGSNSVGLVTCCTSFVIKNMERIA